jgi:glycosyltransferase involved in cell wall biosynthesis
MMKGYDAEYDLIDDVAIYRHPLHEAGAEGEYLKEYSGALYHQLRLAFRVRRERGFDVIHACNPPDLIFIVAAFFKALFGVRFIFDHHDLCPELFEAKFDRRGLRWRILLLLERLTFSLADVSIATNESYRDIAIRRGGMEPQRVFVTRSGPRLDKIALRAPNPALRRGAKYLIGYVGVIGRQEGLDLLVDAASHLVNRLGRKDSHFAIIGDGPELGAVKAHAAEMGVAEYFSFLGRVDDETFLETLSTADLCVNADRFCALNDMSTMNKILEYMALGKPIVQFDLVEGRRSAGAASLYAKKDDTADFARQIEALLRDESLRHAMGRIGRERIVRELSWSHSEPALLAAYDMAFARRSHLSEPKPAAQHGPEAAAP